MADSPDAKAMRVPKQVVFMIMGGERGGDEKRCASLHLINHPGKLY
jgi:hypothetical protein